MKKGKEPTYKFRHGPVPHCGRRSHRLADDFRQPKLGMVRRLNCGYDRHGKYEYEYCFSANKYKDQYLPVWDDRERHPDRCWKTSFKTRKQWGKHAHKKRFC